MWDPQNPTHQSSKELLKIKSSFCCWLGTKENDPHKGLSIGTSTEPSQQFQWLLATEKTESQTEATEAQLGVPLEVHSGICKFKAGGDWDEPTMCILMGDKTPYSIRFNQ